MSFKRSNIHYTFQKGCFGKFKPLEWIADGSFGTVYVACKKLNCKLAIKMIPLNVHLPSEECILDNSETFEHCIEVSEDEFWREVQTTKQMGDLDIGPPILAAGICREAWNDYQGKIEVGYFVQPKWDVTLRSYAERHPQKFLRNRTKIWAEILKPRAEKLDAMGLSFSDMHGDNVMVNLTPGANVKDAIFIDFGNLEEYEKMYERESSVDILERLIDEITAIARNKKHEST